MFFQNVSESMFRGVWVLGDRQYSLDFDAPPNQNKSDYQLSWESGPWDFTTYSGILRINYAWDVDFRNYSALDIEVSAGADPAATTAYEAVANLNFNPTFAEMFVARVQLDTANPTQQRVLITSKPGRVKQVIRVYIDNSGAELVMRFNGRAPVVELPSYFSKDTIVNRMNPNSTAQLIELDPLVATDATIISNAGLDPLNPLEDWEMLEGRSGIFNFQKFTIDGDDRITQIIEYPAGAVVGDFARKVNYTYTNDNTNPDQITQIPYVLQAGDLITPP